MTSELSMHDRLIDGLREVRFSFEQDGERVPGLLYLPAETDEPLPLVLIQHPATSSKDDYFVRDAAMLWARRGMICGGIDAPLHGSRDDVNPMALFQDPEIRELAVDQFAAELSRAIDLLLAGFPADASRLGFVAYSMGSMLGAPAVARDGRFKAAVFCLVGEGGIGGREHSPGAHAEGLRDVAVRIVGKEQDELIPRAATEALYEAIPGEKDLRWLPGGHFQIGRDVLDLAIDWLRAKL
jgi:fermentation-respiration switch protein FrsA (DUF1100 family)